MMFGNIDNFIVIGHISVIMIYLRGKGKRYELNYEYESA